MMDELAVGREPGSTFVEWLLQWLDRNDRAQLARQITQDAMDLAGYETEDERGRR